jgi:hypothetical protein
MNKFSLDTTKEKVKTDGLINAGNILLRCNICRAPLVDVWITRPNEGVDIPGFNRRVEWDLQADCPHCGNKSPKKRILGGFMLGDTEYTRYIDFPEEDGVIHIKTVKVKNYGVQHKV